MKFEPKDYIALATAILTVGSVVWKGGQITNQLEQTAEAVKTMAPVVNRLDSTTARLDAVTTANTLRITEATRRIETLEAARMAAR